MLLGHWLIIHLKKFFMRKEKKKTINILTVFFISHKNCVKTFLKQIVNQCFKDTCQHDSEIISHIEKGIYKAYDMAIFCHLTYIFVFLVSFKLGSRAINEQSPIKKRKKKVNEQARDQQGLIKNKSCLGSFMGLLISFIWA